MKQRPFNFEKLIAWQKAKDLCIMVYKLTEKLPADEKYNFTIQIRRAAQSIASNIAEGSSRKSNKEKIRFINISFSSLAELSSQIIISNEIFNYLSKQDEEIFRENSNEIGKILSGLKKSLN